MATLLSIETAAAYVEGLPEVIGTFPAGAKLVAEEVQGGNLNYAFRVSAEGAGSVFLKQAPDFIKVFGPEAKLHRERLELEVRAYREWEDILGAEAAARFLPRILHPDLDNMVCVMEDLRSHQPLDLSLFAGVASEHAASAMGEFLGSAHARTHCAVVPAARAAELAEVFANEKLRDIQLEYVFGKAFREAPQAERLRGDGGFQAQLEALRALYRGEGMGNLALCHGDLHPGSVMVDAGSGSVKVIDPEFAVYGPPGLDVGSLLSGYVLAYIAQVCAGGKEAAAGLRGCMESLWRSYEATSRAGGISAALVQQTAADAVGFAACEVGRTVLGCAGVRSLPIEDEKRRAVAEQAALDLVHRCIAWPRDRGLALLLEELDRVRRCIASIVLETGPRDCGLALLLEAAAQAES